MNKRPFGKWDSPVTAAMVAGSVRFGDIKWDSDGQSVVWLEGRSGHGVLVAYALTDKRSWEPVSPEHSVQAEVGYGGGDFTVDDGVLYYVVKGSGSIFRQALGGGAATVITPDEGRAASMVVSPCGLYLVYVHQLGGEDRLMLVDTAGSCAPQVVASGHDFCMQPRWSPDGSMVAWVSWDHPKMPWECSWLLCARVCYDDGAQLPTLSAPETLAGGNSSAVFQPEFVSDGSSLVFVWDVSGWSELWLWNCITKRTEQVSTANVEHGLPAWIQDMRSYGLCAERASAVVACLERGRVRLTEVVLATGERRVVNGAEAYGDVAQLSVSSVGRRVAFVGSAPSLQPSVVCLDDAGHSTVLARASQCVIDSSVLVKPEAVSWQIPGGGCVHGLFYFPESSRFVCEGRPPLIVQIHGGPTGCETTRFNPQVQYFATRGYAVLSLNYRGSTGYGRHYMRAIAGQWGVVDVEDAVSAVNYLSEAYNIDSNRVVIMGGSAGGYTVLQALIHAPTVFAAGICYYGVTDLFTLVEDTHKFELHYTDYLVGKLPEASNVYRERSPLYHAHRIERPLAIFQGGNDKVVPLSQAEAIVKVLRDRQIDHVYRVYRDEGHGFRQQETINDFYETMESFLQQVVLGI